MNNINHLVILVKNFIDLATFIEYVQYESIQSDIFVQNSHERALPHKIQKKSLIESNRKL